MVSLEYSFFILFGDFLAHFYYLLYTKLEYADFPQRFTGFDSTLHRLVAIWQGNTDFNSGMVGQMDVCCS